MHKEILTEEQVKLLPLIGKFASDFYLVGGTALALQLGHRRSIDFDFFSPNSFDNIKIKQRISRVATITKIHLDSEGEFTLRIDDIKATFFNYEYPIKHDIIFESYITMPDPLTIAAMKAYAMGQRSKWKDYADIYFVLKQYSLDQIIAHAESLFGTGLVNSQLFRAQLAYHKDIDFREEIEWMPGFETDKDTILSGLIDISTS
jgi:hypothetical protein